MHVRIYILELHSAHPFTSYPGKNLRWFDRGGESIRHAAIVSVELVVVIISVEPVVVAKNISYHVGRTIAQQKQVEHCAYWLSYDQYMHASTYIYVYIYIYMKMNMNINIQEEYV